MGDHLTSIAFSGKLSGFQGLPSGGKLGFWWVSSVLRFERRSSSKIIFLSSSATPLYAQTSICLELMRQKEVPFIGAGTIGCALRNFCKFPFQHIDFIAFL
jgi:hypothetical protein